MEDTYVGAKRPITKYGWWVLSLKDRKQDVLTGNKHNVYKDFKFWGLTIPDSAKQGYVSDLFLRKQLENCRKLTADFMYCTALK